MKSLVCFLAVAAFALTGCSASVSTPSTPAVSDAATPPGRESQAVKGAYDATAELADATWERTKTEYQKAKTWYCK